MTASAARSPWLVRALIGAVACLVLAGAVVVVRGLMKHEDRPRQIVHNISLIKQPPPPPPKPPEKPPEPPKVKEEVKVPQDEPKPADKPADQKPVSDKPLAVDAPPGAGSDSFGLGSRIGGRDLLATGSGSGAYYTGLIQRQVYEALMHDKKLQRLPFSIVVKVDIAADGHLTHANLVTGSGNHDLDTQIVAALADVPPLHEVPPSELREVELRLSNRS